MVSIKEFIQEAALEETSPPEATSEALDTELSPPHDMLSD